MGPRAFTRGNVTFGPGRKPLAARCFNGAAGFHPRKLPLAIYIGIDPGKLQWGRGLSPAETRRLKSRSR